MTEKTREFCLRQAMGERQLISCKLIAQREMTEGTTASAYLKMSSVASR